MARLIRQSLECLAREDERDLYFIPGRRLAQFDYLVEERIRAKSAAARYRRLARFVLRRTRPRSQPGGRTGILLYACTSNEYLALAPLARVLRESGHGVCMLSNSRRAGAEGPSGPSPAVERFGLAVVAAGLVLSCRRAPALARELRREGGSGVTRAFMPAFCRIYFYLPYFLDLLGRTRPRHVVVANDHNPETRSLMAAARRLGVSTVYVQHAAVTGLFPPLDVDLAFLDGEASAAAYAEAARAAGRRSATRVFLSGQKKPLAPGHGTAREKVGVAVNRLDAADDVIAFVHRLATHGIEVLLRPHPGQPRSLQRRLESAFSGEERVELSPPDSEPVGTFLGRCRLLLAGHSSIHLEAALTGLASYFIDLSASPVSDFYGFLASGLVEPLPETFWDGSPGDRERLERLTPARVEAARRFSASHGTRWQGREAELVAATLERIERGQDLDDLYRPLDPQAGFTDLWTVRP